jgi:hypothetical protein
LETLLWLIPKITVRSWRIFALVSDAGIDFYRWADIYDCGDGFLAAIVPIGIYTYPGQQLQNPV